jgi:hypothetical protein
MTVTQDDSANGAAATRIARRLLRAKEDFTFPSTPRCRLR